MAEFRRKQSSVSTIGEDSLRAIARATGYSARRGADACFSEKHSHARDSPGRGGDLGAGGVGSGVCFHAKAQVGDLRPGACKDAMIARGRKLDHMG
jgi:hypothetical protein